MNMKVKICGLYREEDIQYVNEFLPDYIGFILYVEKSHRNIHPKQVLGWKKILDPQIKTVGVFVNATLDEILAVAPALDVIQLHGNESEEYLQHLKENLEKDFPNITYWKAFSIKTKEDIETALSFPADKILLDYGKGEGKTFDWSLLENISTPYILAGGLTPENVGEAIDRFHPEIIDLSSGVETDKKKDREKIKKLVSVLRTT